MSVELSPIRHKQIDAFYQRDKAVFDRGVTAAIVIAKQGEDFRTEKVHHVATREVMRTIDNYLSFMRHGIELGIDPQDLGLWIRGVIEVLAPQHEKV